jgi:O-antigen/teichoic acid export membrane protein
VLDTNRSRHKYSRTHQGTLLSRGFVSRERADRSDDYATDIVMGPPPMRPEQSCVCSDPVARCPIHRDAVRDQQRAGLAVLLAIATEVSLAVADASTGRLPVVLDRRELPRRESGVAAEVTAESPRTLLGRLLADHMVRNSLYLILSAGIQAALGFAFWIIATRLFSAADVGLASSLVSAITLIAFIAVLGLNTGFVRYLPTASDPNAMITSGLILAAICGSVIGLGYVLLTPVIAPRLAFVDHSFAMATGFVLFSAGAALTVLTDSVFIAARRAGYNALADGGIGASTKVALTLALVGTGAYGVFTASACGFAAAALASVVLMAIALRWRPTLGGRLHVLKPLLQFSAATYVGNVLDLLPGLVLPLIIIDRLGPTRLAYYAVAFQVAMIVYTGVNAVGQTFLAEGSQANADWRGLLRHSGRVVIMVCVPLSLALTAASHWILLAFGVKYSEYGAMSLVMLSLGAVPLSANNWLWTILRLSGRLRSLIFSCTAYAIAVCFIAWALAPHGLAAVASAWPLGGLVGTVTAAIPAIGAAHPEPAHSKNRRDSSRSRSRANLSAPDRQLAPKVRGEPTAEWHGRR